MPLPVINPPDFSFKSTTNAAIRPDLSLTDAGYPDSAVAVTSAALNFYLQSSYRFGAGARQGHFNVVVGNATQVNTLSTANAQVDDLTDANINEGDKIAFIGGENGVSNTFVPAADIEISRNNLFVDYENEKINLNLVGGRKITFSGDNLNVRLRAIGASAGSIVFTGNNVFVDVRAFSDTGGNSPSSDALLFQGTGSLVINGEIKSVDSTGLNYFDNSDFSVDQRFDTLGGAGWIRDRWRVSAGDAVLGAATMTATGGVYSHVQNLTSATNPYIKQSFSGVDFFSDETITVSAKMSGNVGVFIEVEQNFGAGGSASVFTVSNTKTIDAEGVYYWSINVPSISGKTIGTDPHTKVYFKFPTGATYTITLSNPVLTIGKVPARWEKPRELENIRNCQRYYTKSYLIEDQPQSDTFDGIQHILSYSATSFALYFDYHIELVRTPVLNIYSKTGTQNTVSFLAGTDAFPVTSISYQNRKKFDIVNVSGGLSIGINYAIHYTADADFI